VQCYRRFPVHIPRTVHPVNNVIECCRIPQAGLPAKVPDNIGMDLYNPVSTQSENCHAGNITGMACSIIRLMISIEKTAENFSQLFRKFLHLKILGRFFSGREFFLPEIFQK
jgi:hypothetical protein